MHLVLKVVTIQQSFGIAAIKDVVVKLHVPRKMVCYAWNMDRSIHIHRMRMNNNFRKKHFSLHNMKNQTQSTQYLYFVKWKCCSKINSGGKNKENKIKTSILFVIVLNKQFFLIFCSVRKKIIENGYKIGKIDENSFFSF